CISGDNSCKFDASAFEMTCLGELAHGMMVLTALWSKIQRKANCTIVRLLGNILFLIFSTNSNPFSKGNPANVSPTLKASPFLLKFLWSSPANVVLELNLPDNKPLANGKRTIIPTPFSSACGNNSSTNFCLKMLKITCNDSKPSCSMHIKPSSTVSTLDPKYLLRHAYFKSRSQSNTSPTFKYYVGIQCNSNKANISTLSHFKETSIVCRKTSFVYLSG